MHSEKNSLPIYNKVALVSLPRQDLIRPPAAMPILAAACEEHSIAYDFFDFNLWLHNRITHDNWLLLDNNWMKIDSQFNTQDAWVRDFHQELTVFVDCLMKSSADLIAISVFTEWSAHCAYELIKELNKRPARKNLRIVIGGTGITTKLTWASDPALPLCESLLQQGLIDFYLHGEGEIIFRRLLVGDLNHAGINNLRPHQIDDLDQFPVPSYRKIDARRYQFVNEPSVMINGSRGCVRKCTYCDVAKYWPKFRFRSGANLANEIFSTWQQTGITKYEFSDSLINGSIKEFRAMNQALIALRQQHPDFVIEYHGQFICRSQSQFKEQDYLDMKQAGCSYVYVGVESFSERVRLSMDKKFDNAALDFHLEICAKYRIANTFLMIVGYPTETLEDHAINLDHLYRYQRYSQAGIIEMIAWGVTTAILEDTPLYHQQHLLEIVPEFLDFENTTNWISLKNPSLTFKERARRWLELAYVSNQLGYNQTRLDAIITRLSQILERCDTLPKNTRVFPLIERTQT